MDRIGSNEQVSEVIFYDNCASDQIVKTRFPTIFFILCYRYNILIENVLHAEFWCRSDDVTYEHKKQVLLVSKNISPLDFQDLVSSINFSVWCKRKDLVNLDYSEYQEILLNQYFHKFHRRFIKKC